LPVSPVNLAGDGDWTAQVALLISRT
jgi:hypothetical protein